MPARTPPRRGRRAGAAPPLWRRGDAAVLPLLVVLGVLLAVVGAFLVATGPRVGGHVLSVGAAVGVVGNVLAVRLALFTRTAFAPIALLVSWTVVALVIAERRGGGYAVLPGSGDLAVPAVVFLLGGLVAGLVAAFVRVPTVAT